ncbi:error-prone DNA polymerase [Fontivita pretiosa]|uniref:error-prone DNA polymerase n=1 Tax=Fontivita pretiosa TaxID=2989684 RepID=UPI003D1851A2
MPEEPNYKLREPLPPPTCVAACELPYAELEVTSNFSFLRGASHPDELVYQAANLGYRAIAITDHNTLAGVVRAHAAAKQCGLKLLVGARLVFQDHTPDLLVWAPNRAAYGRLCRLLTIGKRRAEKGDCHLFLEDFLEHCEGLLAAACFCPTTDRNLCPSGVLHILRETMSDRLSLAVSRLYGADDETHLDRMIRLSRETRIPLLATNGVYYHDPGRRALQDVLTCIRHGCTIHEAGFRLFANGERYLKSPAQMHRLFAEYPAAIDRAIEIAGQCNFSLEQLKYEYPDEVVPAGQTPIQYLSQLAWSGAAERYPDGIPDKVRALIERELKLIEQLRIEAYFLTVYDLVKYARSRGILCQGRGSAANSAVCYCIGITSVDPARIDLLFERFVSAARNEPPDIDVDFEHERREEVIQYVYQKYGRDRCGIAAEVITYRGRSAVRDVGKAMGLSLDMVDSMARKLDWWHRGTLSESMMRECGLDPNDRTVKQVTELVGQLLGFPRHLSQHVGGMVMTRGPLCELVPIENAAMPDRTVIEWDKDDIDELGILKVDVLALGMLTCISKAFSMLNGRHGGTEARRHEGIMLRWGDGAMGRWGDGPYSPSSHLPISPSSVHRASAPACLELHTIPSEDPAVYDMICDADTIGVFQIESRAQMSMLPRLRPRNFYDLVIEVAIVRPGPIQGNMVHPYLRRRNGQEVVSYPSEALRQVLGKTLGVPLFQEQAMRIAMVAAGFSGAEADQLRRAMAAWRKSGELLRFRERIIDGMLRNGYSLQFAQQCFEQIKGFGDYGFPESHAASFALLVYVSAWLKRYHPAAFCAALLNSQPMGFYQPAQIVRDAREHGVQVRPIDVNFSQWDCTLEERHQGTEPRSHEGSGKATWGMNGPALRLGFRQIKGLKEAHARLLVEARTRVGQFKSIEHLQRTTGLPVWTIRKLAEADAFGSLGLSRRQSLWDALELKDVSAPLIDHAPSSDPPDCSSARLPTMPLPQEVKIDYQTTGLSLKRHPVSFAREALDGQRILTARQATSLPNGRWVKVAGLVLVRQRPGTASGVVFMTLEDETGVVNLIVKPDIYERYRAAARHAALLQCDGYLQRQGQVVHVMAKRLLDRSDLICGYAISSRDFH